ISAFWDGFDVARIGGVVAEDRTNLFDAVIQGVLEIDERVVAPDFALQSFPSDDLSWAACQKGEHASRLIGQAYAGPVLLQFEIDKVQVVSAEGDERLRMVLHRHGPCSWFVLQRIAWRIRPKYVFLVQQVRHYPFAFNQIPADKKIIKAGRFPH